MPTRKDTPAHLRLARKALENMHRTNLDANPELRAIAAALGSILESLHVIATRTTPTDDHTATNATD